MLTLTLVISFVGVIPVAAASESFDGFVYNGDFELGTGGGWNLSSTASIVEGAHDGSAYALRFEGEKWANCNQELTLKPNTDYRYSVWVKRVKGTGAHDVFAQNRKGENCKLLNNTQNWFTYGNESWVQHVLDFNTGDNTAITIFICVEDVESVFLYDDVIVHEIGPDGSVNNGDFEDGIPNGWMLNGTSSVYKGGNNGSAYALRFIGEEGVSTRQFIRVKGMTDYRLTLYSKRSRGNGRNQVAVYRNGTPIEFANGDDGIINDTVKDWVEHIYEFNSGAATQLTLAINMLDGGATFLYDDILLEEIKGPDYSAVLKGDTNLDSALNADDLALLQKHLSGEAVLENEAAYAADMDYDGNVSESDLVLLREAADEDKTSAVPIYPINGETVAKASWQVEQLLVDYYIGKADDYSHIASRGEQYMRDPVVLRWIAPHTDESVYNVLVADNPELNNPKIYPVEGDGVIEKSVSIQNLMVDTDYYWAVESNGVRSAVGTFHTAYTVRTLWIEGVSNTRDIGGWLTEDGEYRVKYDVAFRGAKFDNITEMGKKAVVDLGIKTEVDLRTEGEGDGAVLGDIVDYYLAGESGAAMYYEYDNRTISDLEGDYVKATVNAIRVYADSSNFPAYFHCTYGRDRTGTMSCLILGLLGVSREDILKDYEITFLSQYGGCGISAYDHSVRLNEMMDWISENYAPGGSFKDSCEAYLLAAGLTVDEIAAIRTNMLEPIGEPVVETGIEVTVLPSKTEYLEGKDTLDVTDGKIKVVYSDGTYSEEIDMTADMVSGFDNTATGTQTLTVTYNGFEASFNIVVKEKSMTEIKVTVLPEKREYLEGEQLDLTGIEVTAYYDNGTSAVLSVGEYDVSVFESTVGEHLITITAGGFEAAFNVTVSASFKLGDPDNDGEITVADALAALRVAAKLAESTTEMLATCDIDGDGNITVADALAILRVAAKMADSL